MSLYVFDYFVLEKNMVKKKLIELEFLAYINFSLDFFIL